MQLCLVSNEILGAHRNGGIGTATSHLAMLLARHGHAVTLFYVGPEPLEADSPWVSHYQAANIVVCHHPQTPAQIEPYWMRQPVAIYEQLRGRSFDVILFQDWLALGHSCMIAKRTGLAFCNTTLAIIAHSSTPWILEANHSFLKRFYELAMVHMEQQAIELADRVVSPSRYLQEWMGRAGWRLPDRSSVIPYFLEGREAHGAVERPTVPVPKRTGRPGHLVFFGRMEERKGINIFLAALASDELRAFRFKVTFLGKPATRSIEDVRIFIAAHRPDLLPDLSFEPGLSSDEAQAFLASTDCIAVMPSLIDNSPCVVYECLKLGVPFITTTSGGTPELIDADDRSRCLFDPNARALARKLRDVLSSEERYVPRPAYDQREVAARWLAWFEEQAPKRVPMGKPYIGSSPVDTTVVITHHERPGLVELNLRALAMQSDRNFDVILVDDGSKSDAALAFLDRVARGIAGLPLKLVRQDNKFIGAARNSGIRHAESRFLIFMDDDNIAFPNMVEVFRRAALTSDADIVTCQMQMFNDPTGEPDPWELIAGQRWAFSGGSVALGAVQNCFGDTTAIYKRELFEQIGYFHEISGVTHEDWDLHLRACLDGLALLSLPLPLFWYRVAPGSVIRTTDPYENMSVVASTLRGRIPGELSRIVDFMIGLYFPRMIE